MTLDCAKTGALLKKLRARCGLTQAAAAQRLNISDKAVSKWERGLGCPDISLLPELSVLYGVDIEKLLKGELDENITQGGNMKRIRFYICPDCGNVLTSTAPASLSCCGRRLEALDAKPAEGCHELKKEIIEDEYYITLDHEMTKEHYISFIAYASTDRLLIAKLYPEQPAEVRFPVMYGGSFYFGCTVHGLWIQK